MYSKVEAVLKTTLVLAVIIWVGIATAFYYAELPNQDSEFGEDPQRFSSIPDAMYYTGIFMAGEWAVIDFTPVGSVVCIITALIGVALFSIPVRVM